MSEIKKADGTVIVERWHVRYKLASSQLELLPTETEDDEYASLRFSCEEVKQLIEELSRAEATVVAQQKRITKLEHSQLWYGWVIRRAKDMEAENAALKATLSKPVSEITTRPCVSCNAQTVYSCPWDHLPLCGEIFCREKHELYGSCASARRTQKEAK